MRDKRPVDELTIEELERILAIKKREARMGQLQRMKRSGRIVAPAEENKPAAPQPVIPVSPQPKAADSPNDKPDAAEFQDAPSAEEKNTALPRFEDDPDGVIYDRVDRDRQDQAWRRFVNFVLLLVEVAAVVGLIFISFNLLNAISELEAETDRAQQVSNATRQAMIPTLVPTPTLRLDRVVLPGGHYRDPVTGAGRPNFDEIPTDIPAHLQVEVRNQLLRPSIARPPRTPETALELTIPDLNLETAIGQGTDWEALVAGVGQVINGYDPSDPTGNVVLAAHNDIYGELFRDLDKLEPGDQFQIRTETTVYTYVVTGSEIVEPTDVHVLEGQGRAMATLISCYPYGQNTHRIVVYADRVGA